MLASGGTGKGGGRGDEMLMCMHVDGFAELDAAVKTFIRSPELGTGSQYGQGIAPFAGTHVYE